jgi:hypothetical protein
MAASFIVAVAVGVFAVGTYVGEWNAERRYQNDRITEAEKRAASAEIKATYATKEADIKSGHANPKK